jgi:hydroxyethylthiazole kinase-like uncharacterized protein yjeF
MFILHWRPPLTTCLTFRQLAVSRFNLGRRITRSNTGRWLCMSSIANQSTLRLLSQAEAQRVDEALMSETIGYSLEQLMELAGLAVALAAARENPKRSQRIVAVCGPGNNGGDGLVAARHIRILGYEHVFAIYPKPGSHPHFQRLVKQAMSHGVRFVDAAAYEQTICEADVLIDALFGFSFRADRPMRDPFATLIRLMNASPRATTVLAVDIPSGWDVERGPPEAMRPAERTASDQRSSTSGDQRAPASSLAVMANVWVSLTAPKRCAAFWQGRAHYLGGRFVPPALAKSMQLEPLPYTDSELIVRIDHLLPTSIPSHQQEASESR